VTLFHLSWLTSFGIQKRFAERTVAAQLCQQWLNPFPASIAVAERSNAIAVLHVINVHYAEQGITANTPLL
jgi:hypothetical protein